MKYAIAAYGGTNTIVYLILAILWGVWMVNAIELDNEYESWCKTYKEDLTSGVDDSLYCGDEYYDTSYL